MCFLDLGLQRLIKPKEIETGSNIDFPNLSGRNVTFDMYKIILSNLKYIQKLDSSINF